MNLKKILFLKESAEILSMCGNPSKKKNSSTGLVFGYVQSGKTLSFTSLLALAKDNGYRLAIILAGTKTNLRNQTTDRLKKDLNIYSPKDYKVLNSPDIANNDHIEIKNSLNLVKKPFIILSIMKNYTSINKITAIFNHTDFDNSISGKPILIIDDEADQASLNTFAKKMLIKRIGKMMITVQPSKVFLD